MSYAFVSPFEGQAPDEHDNQYQVREWDREEYCLSNGPYSQDAAYADNNP